MDCWSTWGSVEGWLCMVSIWYIFCHTPYHITFHQCQFAHCCIHYILNPNIWHLGACLHLATDLEAGVLEFCRRVLENFCNNVGCDLGGPELTPFIYSYLRFHNIVGCGLAGPQGKWISLI